MSMLLLFSLCCRFLYSLYDDGENSYSHLLSTFIFTHWCFFSVLHMSCLIIMYMSIPHISFLYSFSYFLSLLQPLYFYNAIYIYIYIDAYFVCMVINVRTNLLFISYLWISINIQSTLFSSITNIYDSQQVSIIYIDKRHYVLDLWNEAYIYMYTYLTQGTFV